MYQNPTKEFTVKFSIQEVRESILKLQKKDCVLVKNDEILNEIVLHDKEKISAGSHITFILQENNENETKIHIEVSKRVGAISNSVDAGNSNRKLERFATNLGIYLSGEKPKEAQGCSGQSAVLIAVILIMWFYL